MDGMLGGMFASTRSPDIVGPNEIKANHRSAAATDLPASNQEKP